jgi:hypothetical protein
MTASEIRGIIIALVIILTLVLSFSPPSQLGRQKRGIIVWMESTFTVSMIRRAKKRRGSLVLMF